MATEVPRSLAAGGGDFGRTISVVALEQRLEPGKGRMRRVLRTLAAIGVAAVGLDLLLVLVVVAIDAQQFPVAAIRRIVVVVVIAVMHG